MLTPFNVNLSEVDSIGSLSKYNKLVLDYFVHMGYWDLYEVYIKEVGIPKESDPLFERRYKIRELVRKGEIDLCVDELNSLDIEIFKDKEIFVNITCHKAYELKGKIDKVEIIKYLRANLENIALEYEDDIANFLEYLIFNSKEVKIQEKREELADMINKFILSVYNVGENEMVKMVEGIVIEENVLSQKNRFVEFKERIMDN